MQKVENMEYNRKEFKLVDIPKMLKMQCPNLVQGLEARYTFKKDIKLSELVERFDELEREEQFELSGWLYGGCKHLVEKLGFYGAMNYFNLSTLHMLKKMLERELNEATDAEKLAFENGYNCAINLK